MNLFLQIWGGSFYLVNKALFAFAERFGEDKKRTIRITAWIVYILGVPPWVLILISDRNWIAASVEAGGLPSMLFGLSHAYQRHKTPSPTFSRIAASMTYASLVLGLGYSLWERSGITSLSQLLECGVMIGFLMGSYLLAKQNLKGWLFFMLMNASMASLMLVQHKPILGFQQLASLGFVIYGFVVASRNDKVEGGRIRK